MYFVLVAHLAIFRKYKETLGQDSIGLWSPNIGNTTEVWPSLAFHTVPTYPNYHSR